MTEPYKYQKKGVIAIERFNCRALLADEMGVGKTLQILWLLKRNKHMLPSLIVTPSTLKWLWEDEAKRHIRYPSQVFCGQTPDEPGNAAYHPNIFIINYDILPFWETYIMEVIKPQSLIIEECHYISNRGTRKKPVRRTNAVLNMGKKIKYIVGLSGTPLLKKPKQLYNIINLIRPDLFPSYFNYALRYCAMRKLPWGWDDNGASHTKELNEILRDTMLIRRTKKEVLKYLPPKVYNIIPLDIKNRKHYEKEKARFIAYLEETIKKKDKAYRKKARAKGLLLLNHLLSLSSDLKMDSVIKWIDNFLEESDEKLLLVCHHVAVVELIMERYRKTCLAIYGKIKVKDRQSVVRTFQTQDKYRIIVINKAGAEGITLTAANNVAIIEMFWTPGLLDQFIDRVHRIGQNKTVFINYLVAKGTPEESMCKSLQKTEKVLSKILDGGKKGKDFDIYDEFIKSIHKGR